nr:tandem-95 repeat protein [Conexibacter arvalis]
MLRRAYALCGEGSLVEAIGDAPRPLLETPGYTVVPPAQLPSAPQPGTPPPPKPPLPIDPPPPGPANAAPTAAPVSVETEEDTTVAVALAGADPDGDPLTYTTAAHVPGGAVTGEGAQRTFTPAADFNGIATFDYTVSDGRGGSATATVTVTVTPVDDPPVVDPGAGAARYTDSDPPVVVAPALTVADVDDEQLDRATVTIADGYEPGGDRLSFTDQNGIAGDWDAAAATLTLSGAASLAAYQAALRTVAFDTPLAVPSEAPRTLRFVVEGGGAASAPATRGLEVDRRHPPVLGGAAVDAAYTEGDPAVAVAPWLTVSDADSATLASATVALAGAGHFPAEDELVFDAQAGITGSFDAAAGVLELTGSASVAAWQAALRSVRYRNLSEDPTTTDRAIRFRVSDGEVWSDELLVGVGVTAVDTPPRLRAGGGAPTYAEGDAGVVVDPAVEVVDPDSAQLTGATVAIGDGYDAAGDELLFDDQRGIAGSWDGASGTLALTGSASVADYQAALRTVRFRSTSANPAPGARTVSFTAADATGSGTPVTTTVAFDLLDDAPVVTTSGGATVWSGGDVAVDGGLTVADPDDVQLTGATVRIAAGYVASADALVFADQSGISGSWDALTGTLTLTGAASLAHWQTALRSVAYRHSGALLDSSARTVSFTVENARSSAAATKSITFGDAPEVTLPGGGLSYTENDTATPVDATLTVTDADSARLTSAAVTIEAGHAPGEDVLSADAGATSIAVDFDAAAGALELTGEAAVADYQQVLRTVAYRNTSDDPSTAARTLRFTASDGQLTGAATTTVTVTAVNDPPALTTSDGSASYVEDDMTGVAVDPGLTIADPDSALLTGGTVEIVGGFAAGEDQLAFINQNGITGIWSAATGTLSLTGEATVDQWRDALRSIRYLNADTIDPSTAPRTVSFQVSDGSDASAVRTRQVTVTAVNDAPQIASGATLAYTENDPATAIDSALTLTDGDSPTLSGATVTIGAGHAAAEDELGFVDQNGIAGAFDRASGRLTLSGTASVADYRAALRSVTYANVSEDPSETARTVTFTVDDGGAVDATASATATITVAKVNDAPIVPDASASAVGNTPLYSGTTAPAGLPATTATGAAANVLTGASDVDGPGPLRVDVAASQATGDRGGAVAWNADGSYTYRPAAGVTGSERIEFVVTDQGSPAATTTATLTVTIEKRVFYVDNAAPAGGDGRAEMPFTTLAAADTAADAAADTIYVFHGDGSANGLGGGVALLAGQRLLGESETLTVDGAELLAGTPGARPQLTGTVTLASGNVVAGLAIRATAAGARAIGGTASAVGGTLRDLAIRSDDGSGLVLDGTSGTWTVDSVAVTARGGTGIALLGAGAVDFRGTNSVTVEAGAGLAFGGTRTSGAIGSVAVTTAGAETGISVTDGSGSLSIPSLAIQTGGVGLSLASSEGLEVGGPTSTVSAGGTAVVTASTRALSSPPRIELASASSSGGSHGLRLAGLGATGSFRAAGGALSGHIVSELTVDGGAGTVEYGGTIGDGSGLSAEVLNRTGGAVTLSGSVTDGADAGGGIVLSGSSGGTTTFTSDVALSTGAGAAIRFTAGGGHALALTGGNLGVATTTGAGLEATGSGGTVTVTGANNRIASNGGGTAVRIAGATIGADGVTLRSVTQTGGTNAIVVDGAGTAGAFSVTGAGGDGSGGVIQDTTGAAVLLHDVSAQLRSLSILRAGDDGIRYSADGGARSVTVDGVTVSDSAGDHVQLTSGPASNATVTATVSLAKVANAVGGGGHGGGLTVNPGGTGSWDVTLSDNMITGAAGEAITIDTPGSLTDSQAVTIRARLLGNSIGAAAIAGSGAWSGNGVGIRSNGDATVRVRLEGNTIRRYATAGIALIQNDGRGALHATVVGNTLANPDGGGQPVDGITAVAGGAAADDGGTLCVALGQPPANQLDGATAAGGYGIWLRQRDQSTIQLPGYSGTPRDTTAILSYLNAIQPGTNQAQHVPTGGGYVNAAGGCLQP